MPEPQEAKLENLKKPSPRKLTAIDTHWEPDPPTPLTSTTPTPSSPPAPTTSLTEVEKAAYRKQVMLALNVSFRILSARFIVLVAVLGGIALSWNVLGDPQQLKLWVVAFYLGIVGATVFLSLKG